MTTIGPRSISAADAATLADSRKVGRKPTMDQAGKAFEALFMQTMMKQMHQAKLADGLFEGQGESSFRTMLDQAYADLATKKMNLGIGDAIKRAYDPESRRSGRKV